ncbi:MAG: hypothetical protein O2897_05025, partial [bacterium]|nr:hypothetical protein [bacterium]
MNKLSQTISLLLAIFCTVFNSLSASEILINSLAPENHQPNIELLKNKQTLITASLSDQDGISINEFSFFNLENLAPIIDVDEDTKVLIFKILNSETTINSVHDISVQHNGRRKDDVKIVIDSPQGIRCHNCTFIGNEVQLQSEKDVAISGLGLNTTGSLTLQSYTSNITSPILANNVNFNGKW